MSIVQWLFSYSTREPASTRDGSLGLWDWLLPQLAGLPPSSWQKEGKANFTLSPVCSRATEPQHWYAAVTTSQHAISPFPSLSHCKPVKCSTITIIKSFWLITRFNWTVLVGPGKKNGALLAQLQSRANAQTNKQTNEDINKPHGSWLGTSDLVCSKGKADLQTQELIGRHGAL